MTQETKLTEPVQVGLWYQKRKGVVTQIRSVDGSWAEDLEGYLYNIDGRYCVTREDPHDLIRCLGADPFEPCGETDMTGALSNLSKPSTVKVFTPDYPTQFERIFTEVLGGAMACPMACYGRTPQHLVKSAIEYTQEAIKQLKEIEGA